MRYLTDVERRGYGEEIQAYEADPINLGRPHPFRTLYDFRERCLAAGAVVRIDPTRDDVTVMVYNDDASRAGVVGVSVNLLLDGHWSGASIADRVLRQAKANLGQVTP